MSVNEVRIDGRIGKDADVRMTNSGDAVLSFSIANTERKKVGNEWVDGDTAWYDVTYWLKPGEKAGDFRKGAYLCLRGRLKVEKWEREGVKHSKVKIAMREVESWEFVKGGKPQGGNSGASEPQRQAPAKPSTTSSDDFDPSAYDDTIPF